MLRNGRGFCVREGFVADELREGFDVLALLREGRGVVTLVGVAALLPCVLPLSKLPEPRPPVGRGPVVVLPTFDVRVPRGAVLVLPGVEDA